MQNEKADIGMRRLKTAVVTGPTGAVGAALCRLLGEEGMEVYAVVRPDSARVSVLRSIPDVEVVPCDMARFRRLPELIPSCDAFFHLAWAGTTGAGRNDMPLQLRNIQAALDAVQAAGDLGAQVFVGAGSQAEYGRVNGPLAPETPCSPENGYGMAKLCAGQMSRAECGRLGVGHVWPRILSVYGPCDGGNALIPSLVRALLRGSSIPLTAGEQLWDYLYADDAAEALYRLALHGKSGAVYPVGSGNARPLREYLGILRDSIDPSIPLGFGEIPYAAGQVMHLEADISALRRDTGFEPRTSFETGIRKTIDHIEKQING